MREIKFRARHKQTGEWHCGSLNPDKRLHRRIDLSTFWSWVETGVLLPETVGQYTGLRLNSGKEIYEGDIVCFDKDNPRVKSKVALPIIFDNGMFQAGVHDRLILSHIRRVIEVIDNIEKR